MVETENRMNRIFFKMNKIENSTSQVFYPANPEKIMFILF